MIVNELHLENISSQVAVMVVGLLGLIEYVVGGWLPESLRTSRLALTATDIVNRPSLSRIGSEPLVWQQIVELIAGKRLIAGSLLKCLTVAMVGQACEDFLEPRE